MSTSYRHVDVQREGDILCVHLQQQHLDEMTTRTLGDELESLIDREKCLKLVLSLSQLKCVYSVMIARLIKLRRHMAERGGALKLCELTPEALGILESCQLHDYFDIVPDKATAMATFSR